jgi:hypothetical protein
MLISSTTILGAKVQGVDGLLGSVADAFFDEESWLVRYLVIDTGKWLPGREVLLPPPEIEGTDWPGRTILVPQNQQQIKEAPPVAEHMPVSRRKQAELGSYFLWPRVGEAAGPGPMPTVGVPGTQTMAELGKTQLEREAAAREAAQREATLRSVQEVAGYNIEARDGRIGHVQDFIVHDAEWVIRYLVVDTRNWLPGKHVLVSPAWTEAIDWDAQHVKVDLTRDAIRNSPEFNPREPVNRRYEEHLYDYYGRPEYWT